MNTQKLFEDIRDHLESVISQDSSLGQSLWDQFIDLHPADIADFLSDTDKEQAQALFNQMPQPVKVSVLEDLSDSMQRTILTGMSDQEKMTAFRSLPADELADFFDHLSDDQLKKYLSFLQKEVREQVLSLLQFEPDSAGGIMITDVLTLHQNFTVNQSVKLLQRVQPKREVHQQIFVVDKEHSLLGLIHLEDLVLHRGDEVVSSFMKKNERVVRADEDQEVVAKDMVHYGITTVPVVSDDNTFLGVISSEELVDILVEEATEDIQRMASLPVTKYPYFDIPLWHLLYLRSYVLVALLVAESFSGSLLRSYDYVFTTLLLTFLHLQALALLLYPYIKI